VDHRVHMGWYRPKLAWGRHEVTIVGEHDEAGTVWKTDTR
jgi:hypothetical protein